MRSFTTDEIFIILSNVTCIQDVQRIGDYLNENKDSYSVFDMMLFNGELMLLIDVFV